MFNFTKAHGLGNDFVIIDTREEKNLPSEAENLSSLAIAVCHRNFGIGADGIVLIKEAVDADAYMQIINSDGSEAEMCGNAIRCVAKYLYEKDQVKDNKLRIKTLAGIMIPEIIQKKNRTTLVRVDMGEPILERAKIPMLGNPGLVVSEELSTENYFFTITGVSMGNPHCVVFVPDLDKVPLKVWGPEIEAHSAFPLKTNAEFVQVLTREEISMKVWERGVGVTLACGTGACASVVAGVLNNLIERKVKVNLSSGYLTVEWNQDNNRVYLTGPADFVFQGNYLYSI